jgi:hypothetical protein
MQQRNSKGLSMKANLLVIAMSIMSSSFAFATESALRAGQWDMSITMRIAGMPQLSDAQIEQMRQMGIDASLLSGKPSVMPQCITPEQASLKKPIDIASATDDQCMLKNYQHTGKSVSGDMVCSGDLNATGRFDMTLISDTRYSGQWSLKGTTKEGLPVDQTSQIHANWVKAICDADAVSLP